MKRTYLALTGLALGAALLPGAPPPLARAAGLFDARPVDPSRFAVLAKPVARDGWSLLVLEQLRSEGPRCWEPRSDGLIDPSLNRFDFTGICGRYLDSNGYSLRIDRTDLATSWRLRVLQRGNELILEATSPSNPNELVVGRASLPRRDSEAFVALQLDPGWELQRRSFGEQSLNHIYVANNGNLGQLIAQSGGRPTLPPPSTPPLALPLAASRLSEPAAESTASVPVGRSRRARMVPTARQVPTAGTMALGNENVMNTPGRTIALQVIPFQE